MGIVAGAVVAGALATAALGFFVWRRRAAKTKDVNPSAPHPDNADSLERGRERKPESDVNPPASFGDSANNGLSDPPSQHEGLPPSSSHAYSRNALSDPYQHAAAAVVAAETNDDSCGRVKSLSIAPLTGAAESRTEQTAYPGKGAEDGSSAHRLLLTGTNSTANVSTEEHTEHAGGGLSAEEEAAFFADGSAPAPGESAAPSSTTGGQRVVNGMGYAQAAIGAAQELAQHCQVPGVSEAATVVSILIQLVSDSKDDMSRGDARVKRCRSIVIMLERAAKVLGKVRAARRLRVILS